MLFQCWQRYIFPIWATIVSFLFPGDSRLAGAGQALLGKLRACNGGTPPEPGSDFLKTLPALQKKVYNILLSELYPNSGLL